MSLRVAVVGSGPSGFFATAQLLACTDPVFRVDVFDRLPTPFGLVRAGVAPDHPNIKIVSRVFEKAAARQNMRFFGDVEIGTDLSREDLLAHYHAVIYATGTAADRRMGIPGEDLAGSHSATEFVSWYNGHPDFSHLEFDLRRARRVVVVGNGNVAMDVARIMALQEEELRGTDIAEHALDLLSNTGFEEIVVLGRRGPAQASFTPPELLEIGALPRADVHVNPVDLRLDPVSAAWLESEDAPRSNKRNIEILGEYALRAPAGRPVRITFAFLRSPVEIIGDEHGRVRSLLVERNEVIDYRARGTGAFEELPCDLVFRSIGYRGVPVPGVPFDDSSGLIRHESGRVTGEGGDVRPGEYVTGWIKRGPSGVIGTNKQDSRETVDRLVEDATGGRLHNPHQEDIAHLLRERGRTPVAWRDWQAIDAAERGAGELRGRPRVKLTDWAALREAGVPAGRSAQ
ncbi:FAD-dependent oxidoreductase [Streptomyces sp. NPDC090075]|uniref:FAD-dependent oxidoreductase n=1 Tax=Streptomyces sp. NPDC090075 TaxID=3365937 RepID=UPI00381096C4